MARRRRSEGRLVLTSAAMAKLKALAADKNMAKLWKIISPGKKAAAGASSNQPTIPDTVRAAVAAAAGVAVANPTAVPTSVANAANPARHAMFLRGAASFIQRAKEAANALGGEQQ